MERIFLVDEDCPTCGAYGAPGYRLCDDEKTLVLMCYECDATWLLGQEIRTFGNRPDPPQFIVPGLTCSVRGPMAGGKARWATREDLLAAGIDIERLRQTGT